MTFDPFGDFDTRGYLRNTKGLKDPEAVKLFEHTAFRLNVGKALAALRETTRPLGYQDVLDTHKRLFGRVYPWAGQDREAVAPLLAVGKGGRYDLFAHPRDARRAVEHALRMASDPVQMRTKPGEILGLLCHGHPLLDGNGRTLLDGACRAVPPRRLSHRLGGCGQGGLPGCADARAGTAGQGARRLPGPAPPASCGQRRPGR